MVLVTDLATDLLALLEEDLATETLFCTVFAVTLAILAAFLAGIEFFYVKGFIEIYLQYLKQDVLISKF